MLPLTLPDATVDRHGTVDALTGSDALNTTVDVFANRQRQHRRRRRRCPTPPLKTPPSTLPDATVNDAPTALAATDATVATI